MVSVLVIVMVSVMARVTVRFLASLPPLATHPPTDATPQSSTHRVNVKRSAHDTRPYTSAVSQRSQLHSPSSSNLWCQVISFNNLTDPTPTLCTLSPPHHSASLFCLASTLLATTGTRSSSRAAHRRTCLCRACPSARLARCGRAAVAPRRMRGLVGGPDRAGRAGDYFGTGAPQQPLSTSLSSRSSLASWTRTQSRQGRAQHSRCPQAPPLSRPSPRPSPSGRAAPAPRETGWRRRRS